MSDEPLTLGRTGEWGIRDTDAPCELFAPTVASLLAPSGMIGLWITAPGDGDCMGDGHYLCGECYELSRKSPLWPCADDERDSA